MKLDQTLLIATANQHKAQELAVLFEPLGLQIETLLDYPDLPSVEETGFTFEQNARLKAETIAQQTGRIVLADDSGLAVKALHGQPGVYSARYAGEPKNDARNNAKLLAELGGEETTDRSASFHTVIVASYPGNESLVIEGRIDGSIAAVPRGENGFGYDSLFLPNGRVQTFGEMDASEKNEISHRAIAVKQLLKELPQWLNNLSHDESDLK
ncbi:XTP/dITP diphosphatase [Atopobacter phocae]|uniref:XTP/dITP diphosphatase n=1 Tax=Atopobacter phocae TaxID=136492 RepID=UPI0004BC0594|nr:XTP/dITP diphosphatase [Atopobacter phocae]